MIEKIYEWLLSTQEGKPVSNFQPQVHALVNESCPDEGARVNRFVRLILNFAHGP